LKLAALVLVVAALGLPINDLFRYALLVIAAVLIFAGTLSAHLRALDRRGRGGGAVRARTIHAGGAAHRGGS
jgi:hypothetical protein